MPELVNPFNTLRSLNNNQQHYYYSLPALEEQGIGKIRRLPISIRIMLESLLRNCDGHSVAEEDVLRLAQWNPLKPSNDDTPFIVSRVILQDFTGVPLLVDLAAMRDAVANQGFGSEIIEPQVPVDLVVDHSVQVDRAGTEDAFAFNLKIEFDRNNERYSFLKWGQQAFEAFKAIPPGIGIVHQVNLEHLATVIVSKKLDGITLLYPDTLVGTDSHTTMINGLGVLGWGVGGIEAEAAMLNQPVSLQIPEVIGVHMSGALQEGVTATDLTLRITELLRKEKVVGKFVEFFGDGAASLTVADRATIANMAPEYGATTGFFPVDEKTLDYLKMTGRTDDSILQIKEYLSAQQLFGIPREGSIDYTRVVHLDLHSIQPCVSGPKRPQDRINLSDLKSKFQEILAASVVDGGYGKSLERPLRIGVHSGGSFSLKIHHDTGGIPTLDDGKATHTWSEAEMVLNRPVTQAVIDPGYSESDCDIILGHGSIVIAAITSCTNTSNPSVMLAAGLLAKKAVEKGLKVNPMIKTSLAPGSRVVTDYLERTDLQKYLDKLGFHLVAYGCTTCIGNSGPLEQRIENAIKDHDIISVSVLSGNRNFEARINGAVKANFLMSPPLVVAFAIAGKIDIDMDREPLGYNDKGQAVFLHEIWPSTKEIQEAMQKGIQPEMFQKRYSNILEDSGIWKDITSSKGSQYAWEEYSTYIQKPPYFNDFSLDLPTSHKEFQNMRPLAFFGDSVTTDHISPAGAFRANSPAGQYLLSLGVNENDFNSYGSRRGNHHVMMRGTFANVRLRNKMVDREGGFTKIMPDNTVIPIFEACEIYAQSKTPLIILAGKDYGMGSSRDWAAKGPALLGVKVVIAQSFERIHRSNLIGMGILPLQFQDNESLESLQLTGEETFTLMGLNENFIPRQEIILEISKNGELRQTKVISRIDTSSEIDYYQNGGILPFVLRKLLTSV